MNKIIKLILILLFFLIPGLAFAQGNDLNLTSGYEIADTNAVNGDILVFTEQGIKRTNVPYAKDIFGVFNKQALIVIETDNVNEQPISTSGTALVNVTTAAGPIKKGDKITTSTIPGKGQKAIGTGFFLGIALADYSGSQDKVGQIPVVITKEYTGGTDITQLFGTIGISLFQNIQDPKNFGQVSRFLLAGLTIIAGFITSFFLFSRTVPKSIEAVGRNPLAQKSIYFVTWMNIALSVIVTLISIGAAYLILRL